MTAPITPEEACAAHEESIPDVVFEVVNALIIKNLHHGRRPYAIVKMDDIAQCLRASGVDTHEAEQRHWFDIEPHYRKAGWKVIYDQPGFNETYDATFKFEYPRNG